MKEDRKGSLGIMVHGRDGAFQAAEGMLACCWLISPHHETSVIAAHSPLTAGDGDGHQHMDGATVTHLCGAQ